jgi:hypothetical protein
LGGLGSLWSACGEIHSDDDSEVRWRRSPSLSSSSNRRSVIDDERQSSAATSLTGILAGKMADSLLLEGVRACARWQENSDSEGAKANRVEGGRKNASDAMGYL